MISFKQYLAESSEFDSKIDSYLKAGEIVKPEFEKLKKDINRIVYKEYWDVFENNMGGKGAEIDKEHQTIQDIGWNLPSSLQGMSSLGKRLAKAEKAKQTSHSMYSAANAFYKKWEPVAEKMKQLKEKIVTTAKKREEKKQAVVAAQQKRFNDSKSLTSTLTQHKDEFVEKARQKGSDFYTRHLKAMQNAGGLDAIAPKPHYNMSTQQYREAAQKRAFYNNIAHGSIEQFAKMYADAAHVDYMKWVHKLTEKIGKPVATSEMTGSPWQGSTIHVECNDGEAQSWHTKMIVNYSKYGKPFNQFPTRRIK